MTRDRPILQESSDPNRTSRPLRSLVLSVAGFVAYVAVVVLLGTETGRRTTFPPWYAWFKWPHVAAVVWWPLPIAVVAAWLRWVGSAWARSAPSAALLPILVLGVIAVNTTTAMMAGGPAAVWRPFDRPGHEYYYDVPLVRSAGQIVRDYPQLMPRMTIHGHTHPPGGVLFLYAVSRAIGPGLPAAAGAAVAVTALGVIPAYLLARRVYGADVALAAATLYAVAPSLVLFGATSMDGVFLVPQVTAVWLAVEAMAAPRRRAAWAAAAGVALAVGLFFTFATVVTGVLIGLLAVLRRDRRGWAAMAVAAAAFVAVEGGLRFGCHYDLPANLREARASDHRKMQTQHVGFGRWLDISTANLVAFAVGVGFASVGPWVAGWRSAGLSTATAVTVLAFSFGGLFTRETERIWVFLTPLVLLPVARRVTDDRRVRWTAIALFVQTWAMQAALDTLW